MRSRPLLALVALLTLLLAACGGGADDDTAGADASPDATAGTAATDAPSLDDGVAAVVNGEEIAADVLEDRVETAASAPELAEILESEEGEAARAQLRASVLSQLIVNQLVLDGAAERGLEVDDEAVAETREELATEAGGEEAFEEQVAGAGLDEEQLRTELEAVTALRLVRDDLQDEADASPSPQVSPAAPGAETPNEADLLLQQWLLEQLSSADIAVAPEVGSWDRQRGTVVPPATATSTPRPTASPAG